MDVKTLKISKILIKKKFVLFKDKHLYQIEYSFFRFQNSVYYREKNFLTARNNLKNISQHNLERQMPMSKLARNNNKKLRTIV